MEYNTNKKKLILPEYGRNVQQMVDHLLTIEDRELRNKTAKAIIGVMGNLNPALREMSDIKHKLWDHLHIMADFNLDIDSPYVKPTRESIYERPKKLPYNQHNLKYRHYGYIIQSVVKKVIEMPESPGKEQLVEAVMSHMKKSYAVVNKDSVPDDVIFNALHEMSEGQININRNIKLADVAEPMLRTNSKTQKNKHTHSKHKKR